MLTLTRPNATLVIALLLAGCGDTGHILHTIYNGKHVVEHVDTSDHPDGCYRQHNAGCYVMRDGQHHIWRSSIAPSYVRPHEMGHIDGMQHTDYEWYPLLKAVCGRITVGARGYPQGKMICVDQFKEWVI